MKNLQQVIVTGARRASEFALTHPRALRIALIAAALLLSSVAPALADKDLTGP